MSDVNSMNDQQSFPGKRIRDRFFKGNGRGERDSRRASDENEGKKGKRAEVKRLEREIEAYRQQHKQILQHLQELLSSPHLDQNFSTEDVVAAIQILTSNYTQSVQDVQSLDAKLHKQSEDFERLSRELNDKTSELESLWNANSRADSELRYAKLRESELIISQKRLQDEVNRINMEKNETITRLENNLSGIGWRHAKEMERVKESYSRDIKETERKLEKQIESLEADIEKMATENEQKLRTLGESHKARIQGIVEDHQRELGKQKKMAEVEMATVKREYEEELKNMEEQHDAEIENMVGKHEAESGALKKENNILNSMITTMRAEHGRTLRVMEEEHDTQIETKEEEHKKELERRRNIVDSLKKGHVAELANRDKRYEEELESQENRYTQELSAHKAEIATVKNAHAAELSNREADHRSELTSLNEKNTREQSSRAKLHADEMTKLKKQYREYLETLREEHATTVNALRNDVVAYSGELLKRDQKTFNMVEGEPFEPMLDTDIEARFLDLAQDVDALSRLEWKAAPIGWTEQFLNAVSSNQRLLKKQILQDNIWTVLHEFIFCSPFRIFGDEGRTLEARWNEECGTGEHIALFPLILMLSNFLDDAFDLGAYTWPKPSMETERWRYITIRECRAALRKPVPSPYDPRAKLKKDFHASMETLKKELSTAVGSMVSVNQENARALEKIAMKAARTWLEFGLQRCRILVQAQLQGAKMTGVNEKIKKAKSDGLVLISSPKLQRFGNARGEDLHEGEYIGEQEGVVVKIVSKK